ncbi:MAG: undecaprenyl diphosphate synthase family protein, partial [Pontimonas sp.]
MKWLRYLLGEGLLYRLYRRRILGEIEGLAKPQHVAMILDGNRRWAQLRALESSAHGHRAGADKIHEFLRWCEEQGIEVVTLYLLSSDNLGARESTELDDLAI